MTPDHKKREMYQRYSAFLEAVSLMTASHDNDVSASFVDTYLVSPCALELPAALRAQSYSFHRKYSYTPHAYHC